MLLFQRPWTRTGVEATRSIDSGDAQGNYKLVKGHVYTVVDVDDDYVTLKNPWGYNKDQADGQSDNGLIQITREDYEKYFNRTDIGSPY